MNVHRKRAMTAAERKAASRARRRAETDPARDPLLFTTDEWRDFLTPMGLARKAGCDIDEIAALVLKELGDNAGDVGGASISLNDGVWSVTDTGPGIAPQRVAEIFDLRRPMQSTKRIRRPLRGMLGNGTRIVAGFCAIHGLPLRIRSQGILTTLRFDPTTGRSTAEAEAVAHSPGTTVMLPAAGPLKDEQVGALARATVALAAQPEQTLHTGPSSPWWYGDTDFAFLLGTAPADATMRGVLRDMGLAVPRGIDGSVLAASIDHAVAAATLALLRERYPAIEPRRIGKVGPRAFKWAEGYAIHQTIRRDATGAELPVVIECYAFCDTKTRDPKAITDPPDEPAFYVNRSPTLRGPAFQDGDRGLWMEGVGLDYRRKIETGGGGVFRLAISIITPSMPLASDGKAPSLRSIAHPLAACASEALKRARRTAPEDAEEAQRIAREREVEAKRRYEGRSIDAAWRLHRYWARVRRRAEKIAERERQEARRAESRRAEEARRAEWRAQAAGNPLHAMLTEAAEREGVAPVELAVLSPGADPFALHRPASHRAGQWLAAKIDMLFPDPTARPHPRGIHYALASTGAVRPDGKQYLNDAASYRWLT